MFYIRNLGGEKITNLIQTFLKISFWTFKIRLSEVFLWNFWHFGPKIANFAKISRFKILTKFYANPQFWPDLHKFLYKTSLCGPSKTLFVKMPKNHFLTYFSGFKSQKWPFFVILRFFSSLRALKERKKSKFKKITNKNFGSTLDDGLWKFLSDFKLKQKFA